MLRTVPWSRWGAAGVAAFTLLVALFAALAGSRQAGTAAKAFMFVLGSTALVVFVSVIAQGLTDHPGSEWMARRAEREPTAAAA